MGSYVTLPSQGDYGQLNPFNVYGYSGFGGFSPYDPTGAQNASMNFGTALGQAGQVVDPNAPMEDIFAANRNQISTTGNVIGQEAGQQLNYYGPQEQQEQQAQNAALNNLAQTPGFTPQESGQINVDYSQYNTSPDQYGALNQTMQQGVGAQTGALGAYGTGVGGALGSSASGVTGATSGLASGLQSAQGKFGALDTAVSNPALGFDPNATEKQMTNADVQNLVTSAGTQVGNQFQTAEDTLERQAAAAGNTSPAALAAMRQQLVTQEASSAGDAMTNARIQAQQAQYGRAAGIEQQREGAVQTQTGLQATAATTEEAAAQAAAGQAGQAGLSGQEFLGGQGVGAAQQYGQFATGEQNLLTQQQYAAQLGQTQQQYQQGTGSQQLTSQGAATTGGARMSGEAAYRSGLAGQQGMSQAGGQAAVGAQVGAYGTQTAGLGAAATGQGNFEVGKFSAGDTAVKQAIGLFAEGGIAMEPTLAKVGEHGPEMILPLTHSGIGRYRSFRKAA